MPFFDEETMPAWVLEEIAATGIIICTDSKQPGELVMFPGYVFRILEELSRSQMLARVVEVGGNLLYFNRAPAHLHFYKVKRLII